MRRYKVGVDFHTFDGIFQGSRSHILGLFQEAVQLAPELDFAFMLQDIEGLASRYPVFHSPNVELIRMPHRSGLWRLGVQLPFLQWRHRFDLLHTQYRIPFVNVGPTACTIHDVLFETHPQFFGRRFVFQSRVSSRYSICYAKLLFTVSQFSRSEIGRLYDVPLDQLSVIYNGVDRNKFHCIDSNNAAEIQVLDELGLKSQGYILTVGRLEPRKNHLSLIGAYARMQSPRPTLVIVGQRDFSFDRIFSAIEATGLGGDIRILERVTDLELPVLIRHARIFAYPAYAEGFGMPVAEALASGVPVITSNSTSMPEVAGSAAILVEPADQIQLAHEMDRLVRDGDLRARLIDEGLRQVERFEWKKSAEVLVARYREFFARSAAVKGC